MQVLTSDETLKLARLQFTFVILGAVSLVDWPLRHVLSLWLPILQGRDLVQLGEFLPRWR